MYADNIALQVSLDSTGSMGREEYSLAVTEARTRVLAGGLAGLHHAARTLLQLLWLFRGREVPQLVVRDRPSLAVRGAMLDLAAYGRLPTLATLSGLARSLASLKMTQLHLFIRLSPDTGSWQLPLAAGDLVRLDRECWARLVTLLPAIDILQPCSLAQLGRYTAACSALVSCLPAARASLHLGPCLSSVILGAAAQGEAAHVFSALPGLLGISPDTGLVLCSNSLASLAAPAQLLASLPAHVTFIEYGFQADHPFPASLGAAARAGGGQLVCAGTSSWGCLVGRPRNMAANILGAVAAAEASCGRGLVVASWAASPALAPLASSLPGWVLGLGAAWNSAVTADSEAEVTSRLGEVLSLPVSIYLISTSLPLCLGVEPARVLGRGRQLGRGAAGAGRGGGRGGGWAGLRPRLLAAALHPAQAGHRGPGGRHHRRHPGPLYPGI